MFVIQVHSLQPSGSGYALSPFIFFPVVFFPPELCGIQKELFNHVDVFHFLNQLFASYSGGTKQGMGPDLCPSSCLQGPLWGNCGIGVLCLMCNTMGGTISPTCPLFASFSLHASKFVVVCICAHVFKGEHGAAGTFLRRPVRL